MIKATIICDVCGYESPANISVMCLHSLGVGHIEGVFYPKEESWRCFEEGEGERDRKHLCSMICCQVFANMTGRTLRVASVDPEDEPLTIEPINREDMN